MEPPQTVQLFAIGINSGYPRRLKSGALMIAVLAGVSVDERNSPVSRREIKICTLTTFLVNAS